MLTPFHHALNSASHVLLAGAGGGFDVFASLPLYFALKSAGKKVSLANLSFSEILPSAGLHLTPFCAEISADSDGHTGYFPEKHLAHFLLTRGDRTTVFAIPRTGCKPTIEAYHALHNHLRFDTLVLVDGGTDSLMRGDEQGIGTPQEDAASLLAARALNIKNKFHVCVGLGVDYFHGVSNTHTLEAIAELTRDGAFLGAISFPPHAPEIQFFKDALEYAHSKMPRHESIVNSSILAAALGHFGNYHATPRTAGSTLAISPLMPIYWTFHLNAVADRLLYAKQIKDTETYAALSLAIELFRDTLPRLRLHEPFLP
jgi:hypothetical protein